MYTFCSFWLTCFRIYCYINSIIFQFSVMDQYFKTNHSHFIFSLAAYFPGDSNESEVKNLTTSTPESKFVQSSTVQPSTMQSSTIQSSTVQSSTIQSSTVQSSTVQPGSDDEGLFLIPQIFLNLVGLMDKIGRGEEILI